MQKLTNMLKTLQAKITDIIIKKEGGLIVKSSLDTELKKTNDEIKKRVLISVFNAKVKEIEDKTPDISNLVNKTQLTTVENTLVKKQILTMN